MDMKIDGVRVKREREQRAWTQEHLAGATALSLRTIQRIETGGTTSFESLNALAAAFSLSVNDLRLPEAAQDIQPAPRSKSVNTYRIVAVIGSLLVGSVLAPPDLVRQIPIIVVLYISIELGMMMGRRSRAR
jgi:transcriptional regulator with XRE-family HTH domain